jgi:NADPH:quinone reductase-like Zn-dependent oxidoreductase
MKAVYINQHGGPEALTYGDRPEPEIGPGEVMLKVGASALNRLDIGMRAGRGYQGPLPRIMGCDVAGEIVQISLNARTSLKVGDRVVLDNRTKCGICENCVQGVDQYCTHQQRLGVDLDGGHAEYITAPALNAYRIPDSMPFTEAAALPLAAHTAWHCLVTQGQIRPWDDVLIHAASSGVASMGIQIAKMIGARVITTAGVDWKIAKARELGADAVINYRETNSISQKVKELTGGKGVDLVFDVVGADVWEESLLSLKPGGRLVITGVTSGARTEMNLSILQGRPLHLMGSGGRSRRTFGDVMKMVNQGELHGIVSQVFPLEEVAEAHRVMEAREFFGKLVIEN